jgi:phosphatidylserine decarboxylase
VSLLSTRFQTHAAKRNLNPIYQAKDATFDFPIYLSLAAQSGAVEFVVWDKDVLSKDYMGEVAIPLEDWFGHRDGTGYGFDDPDNKVWTLFFWRVKWMR